jgi:hypothetical protein
MTKDVANDRGTAARDNGGAGPKDYLSQQGAMHLARRLERYWHDRGYFAARFWAEPVEERFPKIGTYEVYRVKCNLVNALPPRYREDDSAGRAGDPDRSGRP